MSLGAPDEQALDEISRRLHAEDPRLGLLFGIFARLTRQEGMPRWERLDPPGLATRLRRRSRRPRDRRRVRRNGRPSGWAWVVPLALIGVECPFHGYALDAGPIQGVWGGMTEEERRPLRQRERRAYARLPQKQAAGEAR